MSNHDTTTTSARTSRVYATTPSVRAMLREDNDAGPPQEPGSLIYTKPFAVSQLRRAYRRLRREGIMPYEARSLLWNTAWIASLPGYAPEFTSEPRHSAAACEQSCRCEIGTATRRASRAASLASEAQR
jgi:hypothetical protein